MEYFAIIRGVMRLFMQVRISLFVSKMFSCFSRMMAWKGVLS